MIIGMMAAQVQLAPVAGPVSFLAASSTVYETATSQNQAIPASAAAGDLILAFVMHRSALTAPAGWTLVASQACVYDTITHTMSVYKRVALSGDAGVSTTWTQAVSGFIAVHMHVYRKSGGCDVVDFDSYAIGGGSTLSAAYAVSTATADKQMAAVAGTSIFMAAGSPSIIVSSGSQTTPVSTANNRLCVTTLSRNAGQQTTGNFTRGGTVLTGLEAWALVSVIVG